MIISKGGYHQRDHARDLSHMKNADQDHCQGHHHHDEPDVLPWGHAHGLEPDELAGPDGWRRGLSAVISVGLRPCSNDGARAFGANADDDVAAAAAGRAARFSYRVIENRRH